MRYGWTLEKQQWDRLLQVVTETDWLKVPRLNQLYRDFVPETPGVYVICVKLPNFNQCPFKSLYNVIYVGKSEEALLERFLFHCGQAERGVKAAKQCFGDSLEYWFTEVSRDRVAELEKWLIDCFGPPANRKSGSIPGKIGNPRPA